MAIVEVLKEDYKSIDVMRMERVSTEGDDEM
jgi:hypothetical protein